MARIVVCKECGEEKPYYAKGLCRTCYSCQWRKAHPDYQYKWCQDHPDYHRRYHNVHRERRNRRSCAWHEEHSGYRREYHRQWREANPDKARENGRRYRARKKGATIQPVNEAAIYERDGHMCMYCGTTHNRLSIDHIVALNNGGAHAEDNLVVACRSCNSSKNATPLVEWLQTQPHSIVWLF